MHLSVGHCLFRDLCHEEPDVGGPSRRTVIAVSLVPKSVPGRSSVRFPHDRHIRFDVGAAVVVPAGFDRLRGTTIWDPDGMKPLGCKRVGRALAALPEQRPNAGACGTAGQSGLLLRRRS